MEEDKVILVYPGFWNGPVFHNGEEALVFTSLRTKSLKEFLDEVHKLVQADSRVCEYVLHCFILIEDGIKKSFIMSDRDLQRVAKIFKIPKIYVSFKPKNHGMNAPNQSFNHHGVFEDNFVPQMLSQGTNVKPSGNLPIDNVPYPGPYWLAPNFHGVGPTSAPYFQGAWPGQAPVTNQPRPGPTPVINQPKPNAAALVNKPKPGNKPVVKPNSAAVVNQPTPGSTMMNMKRALEVTPASMMNNKRRMLGLQVDGYPTDVTPASMMNNERSMLASMMNNNKRSMLGSQVDGYPTDDEDGNSDDESSC